MGTRVNMQIKNISPNDNATMCVECRTIRETFTTLEFINAVIIEEDNYAYFESHSLDFPLI